MTQLQTRPATSADHEWLYTLHEAAHRGLVEQAYGPWVEAQQRDFFAPLVADHQVFVIVVDQQAVGAIYLGERDGDTWLELLEVTPEHQDRGIGAAALAWVIDQSAGQQRGTRLQVHRINQRARQLYQREGFIDQEMTQTHHLMRHP